MNKNNENKLVLTVKDIQDALNISKNTAYKLIKEKLFPVKAVGNQYRIPKAGFEQWLHEKNMTLEAS